MEVTRRNAVRAKKKKKQQKRTTGESKLGGFKRLEKRKGKHLNPPPLHIQKRKKMKIKKNAYGPRGPRGDKKKEKANFRGEKKGAVFGAQFQREWSMADRVDT